MKFLVLTRVSDYPLNEAESFDAIDRELAAQFDIAMDKADLYIGKPYYLSTIESHINSSTSTPLVITGPLGSGKTSLISSWWLAHKKKNPDDGVVVDFIGVLHNDVNTVLRFVLGCLKKLFGISKDIPSNPDELMHSLPEWLALCSGDRRTVSQLLFLFLSANERCRLWYSTDSIKSRKRARISSGCQVYSQTTFVLLPRSPQSPRCTTRAPERDGTRC